MMRFTLHLVLVAFFAFFFAFEHSDANDARRRPQHRAKSRSYQDFPWKGDPEKILKQELDNVKLWKDVMSLLKDSNGKFGDFDLKNIDFKNLPKIKLDESQKRTLKRIAEEWKANKKISPQKVEEIKKALEKSQSTKKVEKNGNGNSNGNNTTSSTSVEPPSPPSKLTQERINEWIENVADDIGDSKIGRMLRESEAWQATINELQHSLLNPKNKGGTDWQKLVGQLPIPTDVDFSWAQRGFESFDNISPPSLPNLGVSAPRFGNMPIPSIPGGGGGSSAFTVFQVVMWTIFAGVMLILVWQIARKWKFGTPSVENVGWKLGPWPIDPSQITTQAEFIKAFEYLAVLLLGREVRTNHHLEISQKLAASSTNDEKKRAVQNLAALYEQARYAPGEQPITAAARREMQLVAGIIVS